MKKLEWLDSQPSQGFKREVRSVILSNPPLMTDSFTVEWTSGAGISIQGGGSSA